MPSAPLNEGRAALLLFHKKRKGNPFFWGETLPFRGKEGFSPRPLFRRKAALTLRRPPLPPRGGRHCCFPHKNAGRSPAERLSLEGARGNPSFSRKKGSPAKNSRPPVPTFPRPLLIPSPTRPRRSVRAAFRRRRAFRGRVPCRSGRGNPWRRRRAARTRRGAARVPSCRRG